MQHYGYITNAFSDKTQFISSESPLEVIKDYAKWLNSPYDSNSETWTVKHIDMAYFPSQDFNKKFTYQCEYEIRCIGGMKVVVYGFSDTQTKAMNESIHVYKEIQRTYNKDNERMFDTNEENQNN